MSPISNHRVHLIPLLMRCLKVTDELAASGTTRGLELECKRYALRPIRFAWPEIVVSLLGILFWSDCFLLTRPKSAKSFCGGYDDDLIPEFQLSL